MRWIIAALALMALSIPLVRALRRPDDGSAPTDPTAVDAWAAYLQGYNSIQLDPAQPATVAAFGDGLPVLQNFSETIMQNAKTWAPPAAAAPYLADINAATAAFNLPANLLARLLQKESAYNPNAVNKSSGALGLAQFMPATAAGFGIDPLNPSQAINGAALYLSQLYSKFGNWTDALAAYNWGPGNVARKGTAAAPPETVDYYKTILGDIGLPITTT